MKTVRFLFNDAMARAIVEGRKTVTRRPVEPQSKFAQGHEWNGRIVRDCESRSWCWREFDFTDAQADRHGVDTVSSAVMRTGVQPCLPGDLLIGRECWRAFGGISDVRVDYRADGGRMIIGRESETVAGAHVHYLPDVSKYEASGNRWRPSIHMPDWAARIRRRVLSVTVERVQDITEEDAVREGPEPAPGSGSRFLSPLRSHQNATREVHNARQAFRLMWDSIYAAKGLGWFSNPWVWRVEFGAESVGADAERVV